MCSQLLSVRAAAVQAAPILNSRDATVAKTCALIAEAARNGANLVVFPECWLPGFPFWAATNARAEGWFATYRQLCSNAVEVPDEATRKISAAAANAHVFAVVGINERNPYSPGTLYNALLYVGPDGRILGVHRKLVPTHFERMVHGFGDGSTLDVYQTPLGRIGGLICWEHLMPLARYAMATQGEQIHAMVFPAWSAMRGNRDAIARCYALEAAAYVIVSGGLLRESDVPEDVPLRKEINYEMTKGGGTGIVDPSGNYVAGPMEPGEEGIVYADLDLGRCLAAKGKIDVAGNYARPDVFTFAVNRSPQRAAVDGTTGLPLQPRSIDETAVGSGAADEPR